MPDERVRVVLDRIGVLTQICDGRPAKGIETVAMNVLLCTMLSAIVTYYLADE